MDPITLVTSRLRLRYWSERDREPFAAINADPTVMECFPSTLGRTESDAVVDRITAGFQERGWGLWAVDVVDPHEMNRSADDPFIGYVGLAIPRFEAHFTPCVEIGWRLAHHAWGHGYATEAAREVINFAFEVLKLPEIVSFTSPLNVRSVRVMQRLGMNCNPIEEFDHPILPVGHPLKRHVLYRLKNTMHAATQPIEVD